MRRLAPGGKHGNGVGFPPLLRLVTHECHALFALFAMYAGESDAISLSGADIYAGRNSLKYAATFFGKTASVS